MRRQAQPSSSLPVRLTSFVGRRRETAYVLGLLRRERSVTLVGAPGVGKTSLALQVAAVLQEKYADGVWFVELAGLVDPTLTPDAIAAVLGVHEQSGQPLPATLAEHVASRELLLVLDNCEHVILACARLVEALLRSGPGVRVLATSREALRTEGEVTWRVPSLSVPDLGDGPTIRSGSLADEQQGGPEQRRRSGGPARDPVGTSAVADASGSAETPVATELREYEAVQLFAERARAALPSFELWGQSARTVAEICRRLDGIPLAIELAAGRIGALSMEEIAARLDDRLALSSAGRRTAIPRQQTLRGAIDWSFELLSEEERTLLRRLAVFAGGWTVPAAEAVCGEPGAPMATIDLLVQLVERSLVQVEPGDGLEQRYRLLEMIRQYGLERLRAAEEETAIRRRHLAWFAELAERGQEGIHGHDGVLWMDRLAADLDNLRAALAWSVVDPEPSSVQAGLYMVGALYQFWIFRSHLAEGRRWMEQALAADDAQTQARRAAGMLTNDETPPPAPRRGAFGAHPRVVVLTELAGILRQLGEPGRALMVAEEALTMARSVGGLYDTAHALLTLARNRALAGKLDRAVELHEESLAIFRHVGDGFGMWRGPSNFVETLIQVGDLERAALLAEEALAAGRAIGHPWGVAQSLRQLGVVAFRQGDLDRAMRLLEEARAGWTRLGATHGLDTALIDLGHVALARGEPGQAANNFAECLELIRVSNNRRAIARCLVGLTASAISPVGGETKHQSADLVRLLAAAIALFDVVDASLGSDERPALEMALGMLRERLDADAFDAAWSDGRMLPLGRAIELGLEVAWEIKAATAPAPGAANEPSQGQSPVLVLTPREREIAILVGRGYTNRRIAQELVIAEKTAEVHARNIREKLGLSTRAQIAAWVVRQGLLADDV